MRRSVPLEAGHWASVELLCVYSALSLVATRLVNEVMFARGNTHQVYTRKEERAAAICENKFLSSRNISSRFLRHGNGFDTSLCDWILSKYHRAMLLVVLLLVGRALASKMNYKLWTSQEVSWGSLVGAGMLKPILTISSLDAWQKSKWSCETGKIPCSAVWSEIQ